MYGVRCHPGRGYPIPGEEDVFEYGDPVIPWVLASQLVRELTACTFVDLQAELVGQAAAPNGKQTTNPVTRLSSTTS